MWWRILALALFAMLCGRAARGEGFPYVAYVNSADVYVRSGPGRDYYPTDKLAKGEQVEVYRHDPGGWLAIRPPRDSYSWVSSRHIDLEEGDVGTANNDRVVVRVGSAFSDVRDVIQVRLDRDEKVQLLEEPRSDSPWCKISPPAGEFRWVFAKYVDRELPADLAEDERAVRGSGAYVETRRDGVQLTAGDDGEPGGSEATNEPDGRDAEAGDDELHQQFTGDLARLRELERIDLELSEIVAEDISQWSFGELQKRAELALRSAQGSLERGRARVLLDKLARFDDIKQRHDDVRAGAAARQSAPDLAPLTATRTGSARYDGVGRLSPVVSQKPGGPQYALLDPSGAVLSFVTPAPGINLRPFVDKYVGVNGQRGYLPDLQRQHVSAQRVTVLDAQQPLVSQRPRRVPSPGLSR
jgi:uncharacterized protein YraI